MFYRWIALLALTLAACGDDSATPDVFPDAGADAMPGQPDATPQDPNAIGTACTRTADDPNGACPSNHLCVGPEGASWCTLRCNDNATCTKDYDGAGAVSCALSLTEGSSQMLVCVARTENKLGAACTVSATSSQGTCASGHLCIANGETSDGTCTLPCFDTETCSTGYQGNGMAECAGETTLPNGSAAPVQLHVCSVRSVSALGASCTPVTGSDKGTCPEGHICMLGDDNVGWCTFVCDASNDTCSVGYTGPGEAFCTTAFSNTSEPICTIACKAGPDRPCPRCNEQCPSGATCSQEMFNDDGDELGFGCW